MNPIVWRLGWALLHFVRQAALIAMLVAVLMWLLRRRSSNARYGAACGGMLAMAVAAVGTFCLLTPPRPVLIADQIPSPPVLPPSIASDTSVAAANQTRGRVTTVIGSAEPALFSSEQIVAPPRLVSRTPAAAPLKVRPAPWPQRFPAACERYLPWVVAAWFAGMMALSLRLLAGWIQVQRIRHRLVQPVTDALQTLLADLSRRLDLHRRVRLLLSPVAQVPMTMGWLRPIILLPASALTGLTPEQLRAILAHELAHIRRYDYLVNILQSVVETLLFYHPAVWWISHRMRTEREHCCDDVAVSVCGGTLLYARALAEMEQLRAFTPQWAAAATAGSLVHRIHRLLGLPVPRHARTTRWLAGAVGLVIVAGCMVGYRAAQGMDAARSRPASNALATEVSGRVIAHTGTPVEGVRVYLTGPTAVAEDEGQSRHVGASAVRTDLDGRFTLKGVRPQNTGVGIIAPGYATVMPLPPPDQPLNIRLPGPAKLTLHFDIPGAEPEAQFELLSSSSFQRQPSKTGSSGPFTHGRESIRIKVPNGGCTTVTDLSPGTYSLMRMKTFSRDNFGIGLSCDREVLNVDFDQELNVEFIRSEGQTIEGDLQGLRAGSIDLAYVMVQPLQAHERGRLAGLSTLEAVGADAEGHWKTPLIPPGDYVLTARAHRAVDQDQRDVLYRYSDFRGPDYEGTARVTVVKDAPPPQVQIRMQPAAHGNPVELEQRLVRLEKERESLDAIREQLKSTRTSTAPSPDVAAQLHGLIGDRLLKMKTEHLSLSAQFAPNHPSIKTLEKDVAQLEQKLKDVFHLNQDELDGYLLGRAEKAHRNAIKAEATLRVWLREAAESLAEEQKQSQTRAALPAAIASQPSAVIDAHAYRALEEELARVQSERETLKTRWEQLKADPSKIVVTREALIETDPQLALQNKNLLGLRVQHQTLANRFGPSHRAVQTLATEITAVERHLADILRQKEDEFHKRQVDTAEMAYLAAVMQESRLQQQRQQQAEAIVQELARLQIPAAPTTATVHIAGQPTVGKLGGMVGTWFFSNPEGDDEQMAIFADGRVVVLYSNGHKDDTRIVNGTLELAEYDGLKTTLSLLPDGWLMQRSGPAQGLAKIWERIDPKPRTEMLRPLTGEATPPATQPADHGPQTSRPTETQSVNPPVGRVLLPDGQPAAGATVVLVLPDHQVRFENGRFIRQLHARTEKAPPGRTTTTTDSTGRFTLPADLGFHSLVVTHESGYAEALLNTGQPIRLQPWGRVEGALWPPGHPEPNPTNVTLTAARPIGSSTLQDPQEILHAYEAATDPEGSFRFDRVAPGRYWIRRKLSWMVTGDNPEIEVPAGSSRHLAMYAPVRGRLVAAAGSGITITPENTLVRIMAVTPYPAWSGSPESLQRVAEHYSQFIASREFKPFTRSVAVQMDGSFALPALPTATYTLQAEVFKHPLSKAEVFEKPLVSVVFGQPLIHAGYNQLRGVLKQTFTVPATQDRSPPPPVGLGLLPVGPAGESR